MNMNIMIGHLKTMPRGGTLTKNNWSEPYEKRVGALGSLRAQAANTNGASCFFNRSADACVMAIEKCLHDQHPSTSTSTSTLIIIIIISIISVIIITTAIIIFLIIIIIIIVIIIIVIATALSSATGAKRWTPRQQPTAPTPADPGSRLDLPNLTTTIGVYLSNCLHFFGGSLF